MYFGAWFYTLIPCTIISIKTKSYKKPQLLAILLCLSIPLVLYSLANTKIDWYILPLYPALAILMGVLYSGILKEKSLSNVLKTILSCMILLTLLGYQIYAVKYLNQDHNDKLQVAVKEFGYK